MPLSFVLLGSGIVVVTIFLIDKIHKYSLRETIIKSFASLIFIAIATYHNYIQGYPSYGSLLIIALVLGLLGDIWLDLKYVFPSEDKIFTYAGFICFGIGHIFFISAMFSRFYIPGNVLFIILPLVFGLFMGFLTIILEKAMKLQYMKMKPVVFIYGVLLFSMFAVAVSMFILNEFKPVTLLLMSIGGCLFAVSDLILSGTYFGVGKERAIDISLNGALYYLAQFTIAFSILYLGTNLF